MHPLVPTLIPTLAPTPLPGLCGVCRRWSGTRVCADCLLWFAPQVPRCVRCALPLPGSQGSSAHCLPCAGGARSDVLRRTLVAVDYAFPWDGLIASFKFAGRDDAAPLLADLLHAAVARGGRVQETGRNVLVVPIPLSPMRLRERGFNQAWELARRIASAARLPASPDVLVRARETMAQSGLDAEQRRGNLKGAFCVAPGQEPRVRGQDITLVDDVLTTGATSQEAARTLLKAGAASVSLWAVARTPAPAEV